MSRRSRIIGAQAVVVALLVLIVYVTLLRPDATAPLRGIEAPTNGQQANKPPDEGTGGGGGGAGGEGSGNNQGTGGGAGGAGSSPSGGAGTQGSVTSPSGGAGPQSSVTSPPGGAGTLTPRGDQYADAVSALLNKVAMAVPAGGPRTTRGAPADG